MNEENKIITDAPNSQQAGAGGDAAAEVHPPPPNPRLELYARMAEEKRARETARAAAQDPEQEADTTQPERLPARSAQAGAAAHPGSAATAPSDLSAGASQAGGAPPLVYKNGRWVATLKVDGQEIEESLDTLIATRQKQTSADRALEAAAQQRKALQEYEAYLRGQAAELQQQQARAVQARDKHQSVTRKKLAQDYHEAFLAGDEDKANDLLLDLSRPPAPAAPPPPVDEGRITASVLARVKIQKFSSRDAEATQWLATAAPDIATNPHLKQIATGQAEAILKEEVARGQAINAAFGPHDVDPMKVYEQAVKRTREIVSSLVAPATSQQEARVDRKRATVSNRFNSGATSRAIETIPARKTVAQIVADMRKARGSLD